MKYLNSSVDDTIKREEHIEGIARRVKTPGNSSCLLVNIGQQTLVGRGGELYDRSNLRVMFKSGKDMVYFDSCSDRNVQSDIPDSWIFIDLKRNRCYVAVKNKFIDIDFAIVLYTLPDPLGELPESGYDSGCYCVNGNCTILYDADILGSIADLTSHYFSDLSTRTSENACEMEVETDA